MLDNYIEELRPYVIELFKNDSSGHDMSHLIRTMNVALHIQKREGGDEIIIGISAFLHDVHRIMQNETGKFVSPKDSISKVRKILSHIDLTDEQISKICFAIEHHEDYNWNGNNVSDINTLILQDADNLDAIGAIGIGRLFSYCGKNGLEMYNENIPLETSNNYNEDKMDPTAIHHFYHKLFKLEKNMNTKTAKKIAKDRTKIMKGFVKEFLDEWKNEK